MAYSTDWKIFSPALVGWQPISEVSTTQRHDLGTIVQAVDRGANQNGVGEFIYVKGVASGATAAWVGINQDDGGTTLAVANGIYPLVGVLMSTLDAATDFGWAQISGKAVGKALAAFADNGNVYLTATAGSVDDAVVAGDLVHRAKGASALDFPATGMAEFEISRSSTDDDVDDNLGP
jgi:hypothetical protein